MKSKLIALLATALLSTTSFAAGPDTQVIEYYHPLLKHYFITASAADARFVDAGNAGAGWARTGVSFSAWSSRDLAPANASMVYRYYSHGANSHVYVASDADVTLLNGLEAKERASIAGTSKSFLGWGLEGEAFLTVLPQAGQCPAGSQPITRIYNRNFAGNEGSNHRYVSDDSLTRSMEDRQWEAEGAVFCSPQSAGSTASGSSSAALAGSYSGNVQFKFEEFGKPEVKSRAALSLLFAADGSISGSGAGCKFAGSAAAKSATSNRLRGGSITATGCTDARFNGIYGRVEIEQFGAKAIDVRFKQGDNAREVEIEGVLNAEVASTPPPITPVPSNGGAAAGDFSGILSVMITQRLADKTETVILNVNQLVALKVGNTGAITGTVQGCTISGTIAPGVNGRFNGSVTVTGCAEVRLNGTYVVGVHLEDGGAIEVELEREVEQGGVRIKVTIEGNLARSAGSTTPPTPTPPGPPASGIAIAGSYAGNASFEATRRPNGGRETVEVSKTQALTLTVSSAGSVSGSGAGCTFSGNLASNQLGGFTGTITATGCTDAIIRGSYVATASREDGNAVEFELERETETNGERVKVKIKGRLNKQ